MQPLSSAFLCICFVFSAAAEEITFPELPDTPAQLLEILKTAGDRYAIRGSLPDYVQESDLPHLVSLLDSEEPCAFVDLSISSIYYPGRSTVGREAAYLIEGFWKRNYPTGLTSQQYSPNSEEMKRWYRMWTNLRKVTAEAGTSRNRPHYHLVQTQVVDEVPQHGAVESATVYVLNCPTEEVFIFRALHSPQLEEIVKHFPPGSTLHYDGHALLASPPEDQLAALQAFCEASKIELVIGPTN